MAGQAMTAKRMREIAALLLEDVRRFETLAKTCDECARDAQAKPDPAMQPPEYYRKAANLYRFDAGIRRTAASELQNHSFTMQA